MDTIEALDVIGTLANGFDPRTGEALDGQGPLGEAQVVRALFVAARALEQDAERHRRPKHPNGGRPWDEDGERRLGEGFDAGRTVAELARELGRSTSLGLS